MPQAAIAPVIAGIGAMMSKIAIGALIGAAIGGISAAIMGGSIGKGILFGAIGGAVTAGVGSYLSGAANAGTATVSQGALQSSFVTAGVDSAGRSLSVPAMVGAGGAGSGAGGGAIAGWANGMGSTFVQGGLGMLGSAMEGHGLQKASDKAAAAAIKASEVQHERDKELLAMNLAAKSGGGGSASSDALEATKLQLEVEREKMADARNQWNTARQDALDKVSTQKSALAGIRASRDGDGEVPEGTPGIDRQGNEDLAGLFGDPRQQVERDPLAAPDPLMTEEEEKIYA